MLKFSTDLIVHKGSVVVLLSAVGGLLMSVTGGTQCVDMAVMTAQNPANLLRLSNLLIRLVGLRHRMRAPNSRAKRKLKRLYVTDSFNSLLYMTGTTRDFVVFHWSPASPERQTNLQPTSANCVSARRCRIYYVLICGVSSHAILTLRTGHSNKMKTYNPANQLQWLINFSSKAQARGDVIFLLLAGQTGQINRGLDTKEPTSLTLGLAVLSVVFLWMFLPHIVVFAVISLGWKVHRQYISARPEIQI